MKKRKRRKRRKKRKKRKKRRGKEMLQFIVRLRDYCTLLPCGEKSWLRRWWW